MSCIITYRGSKYTQEQFKEYIYSNKNEFSHIIASNKNVIDSFKRKMEGIDFVFSQSPELASIGSKAQYLQYLSTIFPNSKVKDIVYHGTDIKREQLSSISNRLKTRLTILNEGFDGFGKRLGLFYQNQKIGEIVYRTKDYLEHKGYPVVNELHIGFEEKFQGKGYFQDALLEFLKYDNTPIYIAEGRVVNNNVFKAIDKLDKNKLDTFKLEGHGHIITLPVEYVYDKTGGEEGIYFTNLKERAEYYSDWRSGFNISGEVQGTGETPNYIVYSAVLNMENPSSGNEIKNKATISTKDRYKIKGDSLKYDVEVQSGEQEIEYVVFEPEQIHVLGSNSDIQQFKQYVQTSSGKNWTNVKNNKEPLTGVIKGVSQDVSNWQTVYNNFDNATNLLSDITTNTKNNSGKILALNLLRFEELQKVEVRAVDGFKMPDGSRAVGYYFPGSQRIDILKNLDLNSFESVFLHEAIHAVTVNEYNSNKEFKNKIDRLYNHMLQFKNNRTATGELLSTMYGMTNAREFMAEAMSNTKFISELSKYKSPFEESLKEGKSVFLEFIDLIIDMIYSTVKQTSKDSQNTQYTEGNVAEAVLNVINNYAAVTASQYQNTTTASQGWTNIKNNCSKLI